MTVASNENQSQTSCCATASSTGSRAASSSATSATTSSCRSTTSSSATTPGIPATHTTNYDPAKASRMTPADVAQAVAWSQGARRAPRLRLQRRRQRALQGRPRDDDRPAGRRVRRPGDARRVRLHQPHLRPPEPRLLDGVVHRQGRSPTTSPGAASTACRSTPPRSSPASTPAWPTRGPATPARSTRRAFDDVDARRPAATIPAGTYDYALTAQSPAGETTASVVPGVAVAADQKVDRDASTPSATRSPTTSTAAPAGANSVDAGRARSPRSATAATDDGTDPIALTHHRHRRRRARPARRRPPTAPRSRPTRRTRTTCRASTARGHPLRGHRRLEGLSVEPDRRSPARCSRPGARSPRARVRRPSRATRATSTTTSPAGPAARRVQLDLRRARQRRRLRARSPASRRAAPRRPRGPST